MDDLLVGILEVWMIISIFAWKGGDHLLRTASLEGRNNGIRDTGLALVETRQFIASTWTHRDQS